MDKKSVLIIDDNEDFCELMCAALKLLQCEVRVANTSDEAFAELSHTQFPDVIILDYQLTGMTGIDFLDRLATRNGAVLDHSSIILCTAGRGIQDERIKGCINKMVSLQELIQTVDAYLQKLPDTYRVRSAKSSLSQLNF